LYIYLPKESLLVVCDLVLNFIGVVTFVDIDNGAVVVLADAQLTKV